MKLYFWQDLDQGSWPLFQDIWRPSQRADSILKWFADEEGGATNYSYYRQRFRLQHLEIGSGEMNKPPSPPNHLTELRIGRVLPQKLQDIAPIKRIRQGNTDKFPVILGHYPIKVTPDSKGWEEVKGFLEWCGATNSVIGTLKIMFDDLFASQRQDVPIGVSKWREHGRKFGYWNYFEKEIRQEMEDKIDKMIETAKKLKLGDWRMQVADYLDVKDEIKNEK